MSRVALVTGGTRGIGAAIAKALKKEGYKVAANYAGNDEAAKKCSEETGIRCEVTGLVGIYTDPRHVILYTSNGEARQEFSVVYVARPVGGTLTPSDESTQVRWTPAEAVAELQLDRSMRMRIDHYLTGPGTPHLG